MTHESLVQEVVKIINNIPQCDKGGTFKCDTEAGAKEIVDLLSPEAKPGRVEELIDELTDAIYDDGMTNSHYESVASRTAKNEAHDALTAYVKALEAKSTPKP